MTSFRISVFSLLLVAVFHGEAKAEGLLGSSASSLTSAFEVEKTVFSQSPRFSGQNNSMNTKAIYSRAVLDWQNTGLGGNITATVAPFLRHDPNDSSRTHFDLREAKLDFRFGKTEATLGYDYVFWGKTEVDQIVDVINQKDFVEGVGGNNKLGQPMVSVRHIFNFGELPISASAYYMPYFRERTYLGRESRLRIEPLVNTNNSSYVDGANQWTPSFAGRLASTIGNLDLALSGFYGVSRDPALKPSLNAQELIPVYGIISQSGFEGQVTTDETLWKIEAIHRRKQLNRKFEKDNYFATIVGMERTLYGITGSNSDLGIILEYAWDSRGESSISPFQNDLVFGSRIAMNNNHDSSILLTSSVDVKTKETLMRAKLNSRLNHFLTFSLEGGAYLSVAPGSLVNDFRGDNYLRSTLTFRL